MPAASRPFYLFSFQSTLVSVARNSLRNRRSVASAWAKLFAVPGQIVRYSPKQRSRRINPHTSPIDVRTRERHPPLEVFRGFPDISRPVRVNSSSIRTPTKRDLQACSIHTYYPAHTPSLPPSSAFSHSRVVVLDIGKVIRDIPATLHERSSERFSI